jgi:hypothetical protein
MLVKNCLILLIFFGVQNFSFAQQFDYNANMKLAYQNIFKLKINEGKKLLEQEKIKNPKNLMPYFIENYADFLTIYISENKTLFEAQEKFKDIRLNKLKSGDKKSPYYLYSQAGICLQWAFTRIKFGEYLSAVFEVKKAYGLLKENKEKFPNFKPNDKDLAFLKVLFGAIPDKYSAGAKLLGLEGDINKGISELSALLVNEAFEFKEETWVLYTMLLLHIKNDKTSAWNIIENSKIPLEDNLLNHFIAASVSLYSGKNDKIISILESKPTGTAYYPFPYLDYMMGIAKLNRLDKDADIYLSKFINQYKGNNYLKESHRKLAWHYLLQNKDALYQSEIKKVLTVGSENIDEDKAAADEARSGVTPNKVLLKSRLLCDGNYPSRALAIINTIKPEQLPKIKDKTEYYYRMARINHLLQIIDKAIDFYKKTITTGAELPYYFAANSCIKLGMIYEKKGDKASALTYYKKALTYKKHEYLDSTAAEAKAGINRINK